MSGASKIEWTDATWNPVVGCSVVSPGCTNCYAMRMAARIEKMNEGAHKASVARDGIWGGIGKSPYAGLTHSSKAGAVWNGKVHRADDWTFALPLRWKRPRKIFVNSMGDLFHESIPDSWIDRVFAVMALCPQHTFQVLSKRSKRMREYCNDPETPGRIYGAMSELPGADKRGIKEIKAAYDRLINWPLPNCWLGVSCEDQPRADERIPDLLATPAAVRLVSAEPLLGPIDFRYLQPEKIVEIDALNGTHGILRPHRGSNARLDLIICGGESGPGARPMHPDWARSIRDQCAAAGVPFFLKQWGEWAPHRPQAGGDLGGDVRSGRVRIVHPSARSDVEISIATGGYNTEPGSHYMARVGKRRAGALLDGREHREFPR